MADSVKVTDPLVSFFYQLLMRGMLPTQIDECIRTALLYSNQGGMPTGKDYHGYALLPWCERQAGEVRKMVVGPGPEKKETERKAPPGTVSDLQERVDWLEGLLAQTLYWLQFCTGRCPDCANFGSQGHKSDCKLNTLIIKLRGE